MSFASALCAEANWVRRRGESRLALLEFPLSPAQIHHGECVLALPRMPLWPPATQSLTTHHLVRESACGSVFCNRSIGFGNCSYRLSDDRLVVIDSPLIANNLRLGVVERPLSVVDLLLSVRYRLLGGRLTLRSASLHVCVTKPLDGTSLNL